MDMFNPDIRFMRQAIRQACMAADAGEVPIGAVIVKDGNILAQAHNQTETLKDPTAHAEILAITQAAAALGDWRLEGATLYVTKEPCPMCAGAIVNARISMVHWGVSDPKRGGADSCFKILQSDCLNHRAAFAPGLLEEECREILVTFFRERRGKGEGEENTDINPKK